MEVKEIAKSGTMLLNRITKLFEVKSILSLLVAYVFAKLALDGILEKDTVSLVIGMVFGSFFQYQASKKE